ncbi:unnamed protein product [Ilex paraguariensis]|uniref:GH10 domain-containing protein n=1 Tax=Ilex paraguariensis TaxID=185542 RepID=A0ABC8R8P4_9AQUA
MSDLAMYLEQIIREAHAHPAVNGIVLWASWKPIGCYEMCLTDNNFKNLPTGDVVDKIIWEWTHKGLSGITDVDGYFESSLFHGDYEVTVTHRDVLGGSSLAQSFKVTPTENSHKPLHVKVSA